MAEVSIALLVVGALVLLLGAVSESTSVVPPPRPLVALLVGIGIGPAGLDWIDPRTWGSIDLVTEQVARITLAITLVGVAFRLPRGELRRGQQSLLVLLGLVMPLMWVTSGLIVYLILDLSFWQAMLIGAIVTPTDPVVASSIVTGCIATENLPPGLRHTISAEAGLNDGLGYPFVLLPILLLTKPSGEALTHWLTRTILWEVLGAVAVGALLGWAIHRLLHWSHRHGEISKQDLGAFAAGIAILTLGGAKLLGTDGILAVFVAAFVLVKAGDKHEELDTTEEAISRFFIIGIFALLGAILPWQAWRELGWTAPALVGSVLLLRRLPWVLLLRPWLKQAPGRADALFLGWFGPIGVAALFYARLGQHETGLGAAWEVGSLLVAGSVLVHGLTSAPLTMLYGRQAGNGERQAAA